MVSEHEGGEGDLCWCAHGSVIESGQRCIALFLFFFLSLLLYGMRVGIERKLMDITTFGEDSSSARFILLPCPRN